jgi:hypothetical protein
MEYILSVIERVNDINGKKLILYICKNKDRKVTRKEIRKALKLEMPEGELEKKIKSFCKSGYN